MKNRDISVVFGCCKKSSLWIFVYDNGEIYGICDEHYKSKAHRCFVTDVINIETHKKYTPEDIFEAGTWVSTTKFE